MPLDTFICGQCEENFNDIQLFINHKKECIPTTTSTIATMVVEEPSDTEETDVQITRVLECTAVGRGRGRPRKGEAKNVLRIALPKKKDKLPISDKRHRGRPRKGEEKNVRKNAFPKGVEKLPIPDKVHRGRGRPRKEEKIVQSDDVPKEPEQLSILAKSSRGRGRPRKGEKKVQRFSVPQKAGKLPISDKGRRGRGRPRKIEKKTESVPDSPEKLPISDEDDVRNGDVSVVEDQKEVSVTNLAATTDTTTGPDATIQSIIH